MLWCWWCCHPSKHELLHMPLSVDSKGKYKTIGNFCSYSCMIAYNMNDSSSQKHNRHMLINNITPAKSNIAPPREMLDVFGGTLTIDEFRKQSDYGILHTVCEYPIEHTKHHIISSQHYNCSSTDRKKEPSLEPRGAKVVNNPLKIRTKTDKPNTLELALGIVKNK